MKLTSSQSGTKQYKIGNSGCNGGRIFEAKKMHFEAGGLDFFVNFYNVLIIDI